MCTVALHMQSAIMTSHEQLNVNNTYNSMIIIHATMPTVAI